MSSTFSLSSVSPNRAPPPPPPSSHSHVASPSPSPPSGHRGHYTPQLRKPRPSSRSPDGGTNVERGDHRSFSPSSSYSPSTPLPSLTPPPRSIYIPLIDRTIPRPLFLKITASLLFLFLLCACWGIYRNVRLPSFSSSRLHRSGDTVASPDPSVRSPLSAFFSPDSPSHAVPRSVSLPYPLPPPPSSSLLPPYSLPFSEDFSNSLFPSFLPSSRLQHRVICVVPIHFSSIPSYLKQFGASWLRQMNEEVCVFFFIVGRVEGLSSLQQLYSSLFSSIHPSFLFYVRLLYLPHVPDVEYPPIGKELNYHHALSLLFPLSSIDFVFKFDSDTFVSPPRLALYLSSLSPSVPLYSGRPNFNCECIPGRPQGNVNCSASVGLSFCSGAGYVTSRGAISLLLSPAAFSECLSPSPGRLNECPSSDSRMGYCMQAAGLVCTGAAVPSFPTVRHGTLTGRPDSNGRRSVAHTHFCQDKSTHGGVRERQRGKSYLFNGEDFAWCATLHPMKEREDVRYVRYAIKWWKEREREKEREKKMEEEEKRQNEEPAEEENLVKEEEEAVVKEKKEGAAGGLEDPEEETEEEHSREKAEQVTEKETKMDAEMDRLLEEEENEEEQEEEVEEEEEGNGEPPLFCLGIVSSIPNVVNRDAIRSTYLPLARSLRSFDPFFLLGKRSKEPLAPHVIAAMQREVNAFGLSPSSPPSFSSSSAPPDLLLFDVPDGDQYRKVLHFLSFSLSSSNCSFLSLVSDFSYLRPAPLTRWAKINKEREGTLLYAGTLRDRLPAGAGVQQKRGTAAEARDKVEEWRGRVQPATADDDPHLLPLDEGLDSFFSELVILSRPLAALLLSLSPLLSPSSSPRSFFPPLGELVSFVRSPPLSLPLSLLLAVEGASRGSACSRDFLVDGPSLSHSFSFYRRWEGDLDGRFCEQVEPLLYPAPLRLGPRGMEGESQALFSFSPREQQRALSSFSLFLPPSDAALHRRAPLEPPLWHYVHPSFRYIWGGEGVTVALTAAEQRALIAATNVTMQWSKGREGCGEGVKLMAGWVTVNHVFNNQLRLLVRCAFAVAAASSSDSSSPSFTDYLIDLSSPFGHVHQSLRAMEASLVTHFLSSHTSLFSLLPLPPRSPIAVVVPFACQYEQLRAFLANQVEALKEMNPAVESRIIVGWAPCGEEGEGEGEGGEGSDGEGGTEEEARKKEQEERERKLQEALLADFAPSPDSPSPSPSLLIVPAPFPFSRSSSLNVCLLATVPGELVIAMDIDMRVKAPFFSHCQALSLPSRSAYFPISFSRFNPSIIAGDPKLQGSHSHYADPFSISPNTGQWRAYGLGMWAMHHEDLFHPSLSLLFDEKIKGWGMEDVRFFQTVKDKGGARGLQINRAHEPFLVHTWHAKDCTGLLGTDRFMMCLQSKVTTEGNAWQIGYAHWKEIMKPVKRDERKDK